MVLCWIAIALIVVFFWVGQWFFGGLLSMVNERPDGALFTGLLILFLSPFVIFFFIFLRLKTKSRFADTVGSFEVSIYAIFAAIYVIVAFLPFLGSRFRWELHDFLAAAFVLAFPILLALAVWQNRRF